VIDRMNCTSAGSRLLFGVARIQMMKPQFGFELIFHGAEWTDRLPRV